MEQYIKKSAVVTEIEKLINEIYAGRSFDSLSSEQQTALWYIKSIMSFINHLEVKEYSEEYDGFLGKELKMIDDEIVRLEKLKMQEVDLEKEWKEFLKNGDVGFKEIAIHFFKLGLQSTV